MFKVYYARYDLALHMQQWQQAFVCVIRPIQAFKQIIIYVPNSLFSLLWVGNAIYDIASSILHRIVHRSHLFPGAEALVWEAADWPAAAAVPASLHKVFHQAAGGENQGQTDEAQGQGGGPEKSAQAPWQIEVRISALTLLNHIYLG